MSDHAEQPEQDPTIQGQEGPFIPLDEANAQLQQFAQECQRLQHALNQAEANAAAWQTRANTLEQVIAANHDTMEAQQAHLDMVTSAWNRDLRRLEAYETPRLIQGYPADTVDLDPGTVLDRLTVIPTDGRDG